MRNKKRNINIICLVLLLFFVICLDQKKLRESEPVFTDEFPSRYVKKGKAVEFDADIIVSNANLYETTAVKFEFDKDVAVSVMFDNDITDTKIHTDGINYTHANGNTLYIEGDYLSFNSNSVSDELLPITGQRDIAQLLHSLGMNNFSLHKAYAADGQEIHENKKNSSEYWIGRETCQGLPVFCTSFYAGTADEWAPMQILYSEDGIEKLQILYYFNFKKTTKKVSLRTFDEVADALVQKYSMILTDNKHIVTKAELYFWVNVNQEDTIFEMIPVWVFSMEEYSEKPEKDCLQYQELVNASTAEMLEVGE